MYVQCDFSLSLLHVVPHIDVKKTAQELYGLINYGELRRKLPRIHEKVHLRLNELVYWGSTQVRLRGKTMRIKTPICRALRKLNLLEGMRFYISFFLSWISFNVYMYILEKIHVASNI